MKMSRVLKNMAFSAVFLSAGVSYGQAHYSSNVAIGVKGGVDFSQVFFNPSVRQKICIGMTGGVMVRYIEENHFGLIAELNFARRGWVENFEEAPYNYSRTLNYVELPVLAHIYFGRRGKFFLMPDRRLACFWEIPRKQISTQGTWLHCRISLIATG